MRSLGEDSGRPKPFEAGVAGLLAFFIDTTGIGGLPKGVMLTYRGLVFVATVEESRERERETVCA
jgi:hypothetical protein